MNGITIEIKAPELVSAVMALAAAMQPSYTPPILPIGAPPVAPAQTQASLAPPEHVHAPTVTLTPPVVPVVPLAAAPTYNRDQIMTAGAALIDVGKIGELMRLLEAFGVQAVTQLKPEQLGAFATELRKLGAQI